MPSNLLEHIPKQCPRMCHLVHSTIGICTDHLMTPNRDANYSDTVFFATGYGYRYGLQRIERDDVWSGLGNSRTTMFRMLDVWFGRWRSYDSKGKFTPMEYPYISVGNRPSVITTPNEDKYYYKKKK